jgi:hypothetical protein
VHLRPFPMTEIARRRCGAFALILLLACNESPYEPIPARLIGEFSGRAGQGFRVYDLFLAMDEVSADSVRGLWSLAFATACSTTDGPFSGTLTGDHLELHLQPDQQDETTFDLTARVLPGDSVLSGNLVVVGFGGVPPCFESFATVRLHKGEVDGLPIGR